MRNLKKVLALVLALVMVMGMTTFAGAASFTDKDDVNPTYNEAVEVLSQLGVFEGKKQADGSFKFDYTANIKRSEVAAILYRIATKNVGEAGKISANIWSNYNYFPDVDTNSWYAGYVNYCANAKWITGHGDGQGGYVFKPNQDVTGYQVLAMILRVIGYGKEGELEGADWWYYTAKYGQELGITRNVSDALMNSPASRQVVAELLFRAAQVPTVKWNLLSGYQNDKVLAASNNQAITNGGVALTGDGTTYADTNLPGDGSGVGKELTLNTYKAVYDSGNWGHIRSLPNVDNQGNVYGHLLYNVFGIVGSVPSVDSYGRPSMKWVTETTDNDYYTNALHQSVKYLPDLADATTDTTVATVALNPVATYTTRITECDIAEDVNSGRTMSDVTEIFNGGLVRADEDGDGANGRTYDRAHTTDDTVGAQGRITEIYKIAPGSFTAAYQNAYSSETAQTSALQAGGVVLGMGEWVAVYVDVMLGQVTDVKKLTRDTAGHVYQNASVTVSIGDLDGHGAANPLAGALVEVTNTSSTADYSYSVGDVVLVSTYGMKEVTDFDVVADVVNPVTDPATPLTGWYQLQNLPYEQNDWLVGNTWDDDNDSSTAKVAPSGTVTVRGVGTVLGAATTKQVTVQGTTGPAMADHTNYDAQAAVGAWKTGIYTTDGQTIYLNTSYDRAYANDLATADYRPVTIVDSSVNPNAGSDDANSGTVTTLTYDAKWTPVGNNVINRSYTLYLDAYGNILGMVPGASTDNVGMILSVAGKRAGTGYVTEAQVMLGDGTTTTLNFVNSNGTFFTNLHDAEVQKSGALAFDLDIVPNSFVKFGTVTIGGETYHTVTATGGDASGNGNANTAIALDHDEDVTGTGLTQVSEFALMLNRGANQAIVSPGVSNTLVGDSASGIYKSSGDEGEFALVGGTLGTTGTALVDNNTKFFVARYVFDYTDTTGHGNQVLQGWNFYDGFKNLPKLQAVDLGGGAAGSDWSDLVYAVHDSGGTRYVAIAAVTDDSGVAGGTTRKNAFNMYAADLVAVDASYLVLSRAVTYQYYSTYNVVRNGALEVIQVSNEINDEMDLAIANNLLVTFAGKSGDGYFTTLATVGTNSVGLPSDILSLANTNADLGTATIVTNATVNTVKLSGGVLIVQQDPATATQKLSTNGTLITDSEPTIAATESFAYLTLADNCKIQIVNRVHNQLFDTTEAAIAQYENPTPGSHTFVYELDINGYVCNLYIID